MPPRRSEISVLAMSVLLVLSFAAPGLAAGAGTENSASVGSSVVDAADGSFVNSDEFINSSSNVSVWKRAGLPLRVDSSAGTTQVSVPHTFVNITTLNTGDVPLNKRTLAVYDTGSTIPVEFKDRLGANTTQFSGEQVQLLIARVNESGTPNTDSLSSNMTISDAVDLFLAQNLSSDEVNENFTFYQPKSGTIGPDGSVSFTVNPDTAGRYAFVLVGSENGDAISVSNGNLSLTSDARILGVDGAPVQKTSASVTGTNSPVDPGENITFDLESNLAASEVNHTVVVFNESALADQSSTVTIQDEITSNLTADNVTVSHTVKAVDGVARIESGAQVMGVDLADGTVSRSVTIASVIDFLANETNQTAPETRATGDVVLNASMTSVVNEPSSTTVSVGTSANWTNGTYTYVYIASTNNSSEFSTTKGTVQVGTEPTTPPKNVQLNISINRTNVRVGQAFELTVIRSDTGAPVSGATVTINGNIITISNGKAVVRPSAAGSLSIKATKPATSTEKYLQATRTITVNAAPSTGGGGGGGQGGDDGGTANPIPTNNGATVNFRDIQGGRPISVDVPNVASDQAAVTGMEITTVFGEDSFRVEFTKPRPQPPEGTPPVPSAKGQAVSYFTAEAIGLSDERIRSVKFTFTLSDTEIPDGQSKDNVRLFRYVDGEWVALETTHLGGNRYRATSPGFTAYAIGFQTVQTTTQTPTATDTATPTATDVTATDDTTPQTETPGPDDGGIDTTLIGGILVLLLLIGVGVYLYRVE